MLGAIRTCSPRRGQFVSKIFLVPKPDGSDRFILNLKSLNHFVNSEHFKMEDRRTVINLLTKNCFMATLDLQDAYFLIPVKDNHRKFLCFRLT